MEIENIQATIYTFFRIKHQLENHSELNQRSFVFKNDGKLLIADWISINSENYDNINLNLEIDKGSEFKEFKELKDKMKDGLIDHMDSLIEAVNKINMNHINFTEKVTNIEFLEIPNKKFKYYKFQENFDFVGII